MTRISEHLTKEELTLWLARFMMRDGYTYNQEKIRKQRVDSFLAEARKNWTPSCPQ